MTSSTTTDKTYNGWTNYETWAVGLYLDGNYDGQGTYSYVLELVRDIVQERNQAGALGDQPFYASCVADALKDWFEETLPKTEGIVSDLLGSALSEINWRELAESKLTEIAEEQS